MRRQPGAYNATEGRAMADIIRNPIVMPKPDLLALAGAYRKTPVMQIDADVYCDTDCIAPRNRASASEPDAIPERHGGILAHA